MKRFSLAIIFALALLPAAALADSVTVGDLEFNPQDSITNNFTVDNYTGSNNFGYFPVADDVTFDNVILTATESDGTLLIFDLGNIGPGSDDAATFSNALLFTQVVFSATLDPSTFTLTNGSSGTFAADPTLSFTLLPSSGSYLAAGVDLGLINATSSVVTPEPSCLSLMALGLGLLALCARNNRNILPS